MVMAAAACILGISETQTADCSKYQIKSKKMLRSDSAELWKEFQRN